MVNHGSAVRPKDPVGVAKSMTVSSLVALAGVVLIFAALGAIGGTEQILPAWLFGTLGLIGMVGGFATYLYTLRTRDPFF